VVLRSDLVWVARHPSDGEVGRGLGSRRLAVRQQPPEDLPRGRLRDLIDPLDQADALLGGDPLGDELEQLLVGYLRAGDDTN